MAGISVPNQIWNEILNDVKLSFNCLVREEVYCDEASPENLRGSPEERDEFDFYLCVKNFTGLPRDNF